MTDDDEQAEFENRDSGVNLNRTSANDTEEKPAHGDIDSEGNIYHKQVGMYVSEGQFNYLNNLLLSEDTDEKEKNSSENKDNEDEKQDNKENLSLVGCGPTEPRLYWEKSPEIEQHHHGKNRNDLCYYITKGIHSSDPYFEGANIMTIAHTYYPEDDEHFYFWDRGFDQWIEFDPTDIGFTAEEVSKGAVYSIGAAGAIVGGLLILENGAIINTVRQGGKKVLVNSWKRILANSSMDALNQFMIQGGELEQIDWVDVAASGLFKNKHLKNLVSAAVEYKIVNGTVRNYEIKDIVMNFMIQTGTDKLFNTFSMDSGNWNKEMGEDLLEKLIKDEIEQKTTTNEKK